MRLIILLLIAVLLPSVTIDAQTDISYKEWKDGPLSPDDFMKRRGTGELIGQITSGISSYTGEWEKITWNTRVKRWHSKTLFDPIKSWIRTDTLSNQALEYCQLIFDVAEVTRRKMQNHLMSSPFNPDYKSTMSRYYDMHNARTEEIEMATDKGKDLDELRIFQKIVAEELATISEVPATVPEYVLRKFSLGMSGGIATQIHSGRYGSYFGPGYGLLFGFDFGIGRSEIHWDTIMGGGSRLHKDIQGRDIDTWTAGQRLMYGDISFQYAYNIYDSENIKISPLIGFGLGFMDYTAKDKKTEIRTDEISGIRLLAGISIELKYLRSLYLVPDYTWSSIYGGLNEHSARLKVYVANTSYGNRMDPYSINIALCTNILSKYMKP